MKRAFSLIITSVLTAASVLALDSSRFQFQIERALADAFNLLLEIFSIPSVRIATVIITFFALIYNTITPAAKSIKIFGDSPKKVTVPLSLLMTLAAYYIMSARMDIEKIFMPMLIILNAIIFLRILSWFGLFRAFQPSSKRMYREAINNQKDISKSRLLESNQDTQSELDELEKEFLNEEKNHEHVENELDEADESIEGIEEALRQLNTILHNERGD